MTPACSGGRRSSPGHLSPLIEQPPQTSVWTTDRDLRLTSLAGAALALLGVDDPEAVVGRELADLVRGASGGGTAIVNAHRRALDGESATFTELWRNWAFDVYVEPLREDDREVGERDDEPATEPELARR